MTLVEQQPKAIKIWSTDIKKVYLGTTQVRPKPDTRTFTISWTESSNMSSGWTYSDDAAGLTAGSTDFDEFFWYSGVRLSAAWVETASVAQSTPWTLDITQLGTLTSGDNVMIKFPVMWVKMSKAGSTVTLSLTRELNKTWYQYYAFSRGTTGSPVLKNSLYLGVYKWYTDSSVLKSWSGQSPTTIQTQSTFITQARANDNNDGSAGYDIIWFYQRMFVNALYIMKYWNPNSQSVIGMWYSGWSAKKNTGGTDSTTDATYGGSSTTQVKLFWLEDRWWNVSEWLWGACVIGNSLYLYTALSWFTGTATNSSPYSNTGSSITNTSGYYSMSSIVGNNEAMFAPTATVASYTQYYCDYVTVAQSRILHAGGYWNQGTVAGVFCTDYATSETAGYSNNGARLMYL